MTNPTRQEKLAREWAEHYKDDFPQFMPGTHAAEIVEKAKAAAEYILAHTNPPTMAEVEWDDDKHYLAEAETHELGKVVMLRKTGGLIEFTMKPYTRQTKGSIWPEKLTPTGKRYTLTEVQE